jgi:hypothetical protein
MVSSDRFSQTLFSYLMIQAFVSQSCSPTFCTLGKATSQTSNTALLLPATNKIRQGGTYDFIAT